MDLAPQAQLPFLSQIKSDAQTLQKNDLGNNQLPFWAHLHKLGDRDCSGWARKRVCLCLDMDKKTHALCRVEFV